MSLVDGKAHCSRQHEAFSQRLLSAHLGTAHWQREDEKQIGALVDVCNEEGVDTA